MRKCTSKMNENLTPLRPAIKSQSAPNSPSDETETKIVGRRVNFPADDMLVTGYLEPPNPWEKAFTSTPDELTDAYRAACDKHQIKPLNKLLTQLQNINTIGEREDCLSLKGEKLDSKQYEAMEEIFKRIQFNTIDVESTNLDDEGSVALFDMIEYYESASNLNISSNRSMTARGWQACARMLKKTKSLLSLTAQNTSINEQFMQLLCKTLRSGSFLTVLHLENSNLSGRSCTVLMQALKLNTSLRELYLAENKLTAADALQIGNLFRSNNKLELLDLRNNYIQDTGVTHIVQGLNDQAMGPEGGLKNLILISNQLTFHSGMHLAKTLVSTKTLEMLTIGNNNITNEGIFHLKEALMKNRTLHQLSLQNARITCEGAVALAEYIADNPCIQQIDLLENNIKVAGLLALSLSMKVNQSITRLDIDKDYKKESKKELQEQHQQLLLEIMEYCERNYQMVEKMRREREEEEEALRQKQEISEEPNEKLSESVSRLLSLWEPKDTIVSGVSNITSNGAIRNNSPEIRNLQTKTWGKNNSVKSPASSSIVYHTTSIYKPSSSSPLPITSTPVIVLPKEEKLRCVKITDGGQEILKSVNPALLSPPASHPSPPKSRFRVSRVLDSDSLPSSAGHTPMPSPVPSPGHTPMPSPGTTPLSSPVPSPTGSPVTSPHHSPTAIGTIAPPSSPVKLLKGIANLGYDKKPQINKVTCFSPGCLSPAGCSLHSSVKFSKDRVSENNEIFSCSTPSSPSVDNVTGNYAPPSSPIIHPSHKDINFNLNDDASSSKSIFHSSGKDSESCLTDSFAILGSTPPPNTPYELDSEINDSSSSPNTALDSTRRISSKPSSYKSFSWTDSLNENECSYNSGSSSPSCMSDSCMNLSYWSTESEKSSSIPKLSVHVCKNDCTCCDVSGSMPSLELNSTESSPIPASQTSHDLWTNEFQHNFPVPSDLTSSSTSFIHTSSSSCAESDSFVSADSGLATPDSEISGDHSTISLSSHSENGELAFTIDNLNSLVVDSGGPGSLAPPSTPIEFEESNNNSYSSSSLSSLQNKLPNSTISEKMDKSTYSVCTINQETSEIPTLNNNDNKEQNSNLNVSSQQATSKRSEQMDVQTKPFLLNSLDPKINTKLKYEVQDDKIEEFSVSNLHTYGPSRSVSDSNLKDNLGSLEGNNEKPVIMSKYSNNRRSDSSLACQNNASGNRIRMIKLAEPSCVRLFGGGLPVHTTSNQLPICNDTALEFSSVENTVMNCSLSAQNEVGFDSFSSKELHSSPSEISKSHSINKDEPSEHSKFPSEKNILNSLETSQKLPDINSVKSNKAKKCEHIDVSVLSSQKSHDKDQLTNNLVTNKCHENYNDLNESKQIASFKNNGVLRRASTGSFPGKKEKSGRRISFAVDELIQKQLIELDNSSKKMKAVKEELGSSQDLNRIKVDNRAKENSSKTQVLNDSQTNNLLKEMQICYSVSSKCNTTKHNNDCILDETFVDHGIDSVRSFSDEFMNAYAAKQVTPEEYSDTSFSKGSQEISINKSSTENKIPFVKKQEICINRAAKPFKATDFNCSQSECTNTSNPLGQLLIGKISIDNEQCSTKSLRAAIGDTQLEQAQTTCQDSSSAIIFHSPVCDPSSFDRNKKMIEVDFNDKIEENVESQFKNCDTVNVNPTKNDFFSSNIKYTSSSTPSSSLQQGFHSPNPDAIDNATLLSVNANIIHPKVNLMENMQELNVQCNSAAIDKNLPSSSTSYLEEDEDSMSDFTKRISGSKSEGGSEVLKMQKV